MRKYFKSFRGGLKSIVIVAILLPMIVSSLILGVMLDKQLRAIFENRLEAGLKTFSLILTYRQQDLVRGLERIASDNTLQMTLELDIVSQMQKYLNSQIPVLRFSSLGVFDSDKKRIGHAGQQRDLHLRTKIWDNAISLITSDEESFFVYSVPIVKNKKPLGYAVGTISLTDRWFQELLQEKMVNSFIIWINGRPVVSDLGHDIMQNIGKVPDPGKMENIQAGSYKYKSMVQEDDVGGKKLTYAVLLPLDQLKRNFQIMIATVVGVIAAIFGVIMFFMRRFIKELIRPVSELTSAAAAIETGSKDIPDLDYDREDEFGLLNRTFINMLISTNKFVTELKQAKEALRKSEERYRILVDNASEAIFIAQDGVIKFPNPKAEEMIGYSAEEMITIPFVKFIAPEDREMVKERLEARLRGDKAPSSYSFRILNKDGQKAWVLINSVLINWDGRPATLNLLADIGELKQMEAELRKYQEKLELMVEERTGELRKTQKELVNKAMETGRAQLSAMILHNIGNAVTPIITHLEGITNSELREVYNYMVKCYDVLSDSAGGFDQHVVKDTRRQEVFAYMGDLIRSLETIDKKQHDFTKKIGLATSYISEILTLQQSYAIAEHEMKEYHDLNSLIKDAMRMQVGALEKRKITLKRELDPNISKLMIDKNRFMQVLVNIITNSYEAIGELKDKKEKVITFRSFSENGQIGLEITDNGVGIDPKFIHQIFDFGKSSKGSSGFGLHYCKIFVEGNNGTMSISSPGKGKGATVRIAFNTLREL